MTGILTFSQVFFFFFFFFFFISIHSMCNTIMITTLCKTWNGIEWNGINVWQNYDTSYSDTKKCTILVMRCESCINIIHFSPFITLLNITWFWL